MHSDHSLSTPPTSFRTRPRKMLSIPSLPPGRSPFIRRPFAPRHPDKSRSTVTLTIAVLVVILPVAILTFLASDLRTRVSLTVIKSPGQRPSQSDWTTASKVIPHSKSSQLAAVAANLPPSVRSSNQQSKPAVNPPVVPPVPAVAPAVDKLAAPVSDAAPIVEAAPVGEAPVAAPHVAPPPAEKKLNLAPSVPDAVAPAPVAPAPAAPAPVAKDVVQPVAAQPVVAQPVVAQPVVNPIAEAPPVGSTSVSYSDTSGIPPASLPSTHRNAKLLQSIRARTQLKPRWPKEHLENVMHLRSFGPAYSSILISHKLKLVYIPVFKVGTSSMMWHIAYLENNEHVVAHRKDASPGYLQYLLHEMDSPAWRGRAFCHMSKAEIQSVLRNPEYMKFGFVRNPYDRTVSAYLDKVMSMPIQSWEYQEQMYGMYGEDPVKRAAANVTRPTFKEFLTAVHAVIRSPRTAETDLTKDAAYENNKSRRDLHWRPQVELLHPDLIHLDFVGRFDNLREDRQVVLDWMYQHTDRRMPPSGARIHSTNPADKHAIFKALREDGELRQLLLNTYQEDFERFNFSREVPDLSKAKRS